MICNWQENHQPVNDWKRQENSGGRVNATRAVMAPKEFHPDAYQHSVAVKIRAFNPDPQLVSARDL